MMISVVYFIGSPTLLPIAFYHDDASIEGTIVKAIIKKAVSNCIYNEEEAVAIIV